MKILPKHLRLSIFAVAVGLGMSIAVPAYAGPCDQKAAAIASSQNARLLGVSARGNNCVVRLLVKRPKGPPKRRTIVVPK